MSRWFALLALVILGAVALPATSVAKWSQMGSISGTVHALTVYRGELIAAGKFTRAGNVPVGYVARWDGSNWSDVDGGVGGQVYALSEFQGALIVGGNFENTPQHANVYYIASYRNGGWRAVGEGLAAIVYTLQPFENRLVAGGLFFFTGTFRRINRVAAWDGSIWTSVGDDITAHNSRTPVLPAAVLDAAVVDGRLYATGVIDEIGSEAFYGLAQWANDRWVQVPVQDGEVPLRLDRGFTLGSFGGELVVGGLVLDGASATARHLTRYRSGRWESFDQGVNDFVQAMVEFEGALVVGGNFDRAGGMRADHIARWTETTTAVFAPSVRIEDRGNAVDFDVDLSGEERGRLSLRREGPRGSALVDRHLLNGQGSVVLRDPSPLAESRVYWIEWEREDSQDPALLRAGPFEVAATTRIWSTALRQLPAETSARFQWTSPRAGRVRIDVFDLRGRRLARLLDKEVAAGPTVVDWDGTDDRGQTVARGRYVLRARQGSTWRTLTTTLHR